MIFLTGRAKLYTNCRNKISSYNEQAIFSNENICLYWLFTEPTVNGRTIFLNELSHRMNDLLEHADLYLY